MILYNLRTTIGGFQITKFDHDLNVESSYEMVMPSGIGSPTCTCPQGHKPTCRHRKMLVAMLPIVDTEEFYCYDTRLYYGMEGQGYATPKASATACGSEGATHASHTLYETGDPDAPDVIKDRNGEVVLGLCKVCGRGEAQLVEPCVPKVQAQANELPRIRRRI